MSWALNQVRKYRGSLGLPETLRWTAQRALDARWPLDHRRSRVRPPGAPHRVTVRLGESSDLYCFDQIFLRRELALASMLPPPGPGLIMDLGANVGYASIFLMTLFPSAEVLAIEPDPANFEICRMNLAPYKRRVQAVCGAVWHSCRPLVLSRGTFGDGLDWAVQVREAEPGESPDVKGLDIPTLLRQSTRKRIALLKIDIEGSEYRLFSRNADAWLPVVDHIIIETHGTACHEAVFKALEHYDFQWSRSGEYDVFLNIHPIRQTG